MIRDYKLQANTSKITLNYWAWCLSLIDSNLNMHKFTFICANSVGKEFDTTFVGTSCILELRPSCTIMKNLNNI